MLAYALALAIVSTVPASEPTDAAEPATMEQAGLAWKRAPSIGRMQRLYPQRARREGVFRGTAEVFCRAQANGRLDCKAVRETPEGLLFGRAGELVMRDAVVRSTDGGSPEGREFGFRLRFGAWKPQLLPTSFQPSADLRWKVFPNMIRWSMSGQSSRDIWTANYDCVVAADGAITCVLQDATPADPGFLKAAASALSTSKVERIDGRSPEGERFAWRVSVMREGWCSAGTQGSPEAQNVTVGEEGGRGDMEGDFSGILKTQCGSARMLQVR